MGVDKITMIVAGGIGTRMNAGIPKQFLLLNNYPVLMHTISTFHLYDQQMRIMLVLPEDQTDEWSKLCEKYQFSIKHDVRYGGTTRFHSVRKNIDSFADESLVAIHDGVRPLVSIATISRCFNAALEYGNAIPCIEIPETLRRVSGQKNRQVDRTRYRLIQTPQVFNGKILKIAYQQEYQKKFTDDAGVVENLGYTVHLVEGNAENIKITYPEDILIASSLLKH
jgi:2-C-methyl-D-erythritol 4-phosphate cytidylyltransferase